MAVNNINVGTVPNDGTGDSLRVAFTKVNSNFDSVVTDLLITPETFGAVGDNVTDDSTAVDAACAAAATAGNIALFQKTYFCASNLPNFNLARKVGEGRVRTAGGFFPITPQVQDNHFPAVMETFWTTSNATFARSLTKTALYGNTYVNEITMTTNQGHMSRLQDASLEPIRFVVRAEANTNTVFNLHVVGGSGAGADQAEASFNLITGVASLITGTSASMELDATGVFTCSVNFTPIDKDLQYRIYGGERGVDATGSVFVETPRIEYGTGAPLPRNARLFVQEGGASTNDGLSSANPMSPSRAMGLLGTIYRDACQGGQWAIRFQGAAPISEQILVPQNLNMARALTLCGQAFDAGTSTPVVKLDFAGTAIEIDKTDTRLLFMGSESAQVGVNIQGPCRFMTESTHITDYTARSMDITRYVDFYFFECKFNTSVGGVIDGIRELVHVNHAQGIYDEDTHLSQDVALFLTEIIKTGVTEGRGLNAIESSRGHFAAKIDGWTDGMFIAINARVHVEGCIFDNNGNDVRIGRGGDWFDNPTNTNTFGASSTNLVTFGEEKKRTEFDEIITTTATQVLAATLEDDAAHGQGFYSLPGNVGNVYLGTTFEIDVIWKVTAVSAGIKSLTLRDAANGTIINIASHTVTGTGTAFNIRSRSRLHVRTLTSVLYESDSATEEGDIHVNRATAVLSFTGGAVSTRLRFAGAIGDTMGVERITITKIEPMR